MFFEFLCNAAIEVAKDYCNSCNYEDDDYEYYDDSNSTEEKIEYGYNALGNFVPTNIGNKKVDYSYNVKGNFVPKKLK